MSTSHNSTVRSAESSESDRHDDPTADSDTDTNTNTNTTTRADAHSEHAADVRSGGNAVAHSYEPKPLAELTPATENNSGPDTDGVVVPDDPKDVFAEVVHRNGRTCKNCYYRLRERHAFPHEVGSAHFDTLKFVYRYVPDTDHSWLDTTYWEDPVISQRAPRDYPEEDDRANKIRGRRYCSECGVFDTRSAPDEPRSLEETGVVAVHIAATLEEYGIPVDWMELVECARALKRVPEYAGNDHEVFSRAVAQAVDLSDVSTRSDPSYNYAVDADSESES